jgi:hypothetical protein
MAQPVDLTGRWAGHYQQHGHAHPLAAELTQTGDRLTGTMRDEETTFESSVFEAAMEAGLPPGADEQIIIRLRGLFPESPRAPVRSATELPATSVLEGTVRGRTVSFLKTYEGEHFSGYRVGDQRVGVMIPRHEVHYQGHVSDDGTAFEGRWWIEPGPELGGRRTEGSFVLRRS